MQGQERDDVRKDLESLGSWSLPPEISFSIFSRLPVKSLMKCRCVCKVWRSSISTPHLINMHLVCAPHAYNPDIVFHDFSIISKYRFKKNYHHIIENVGYDDEVVKVLPFPPHLNALDIVDSCNGLFCLVEPYSRMSMHVYNPCTRENIQLPSPPSQLQSALFGFGHDPVHDEYKVLTLFTENPTSGSPKLVAEVCILDSNVWRRMAEVPFTPIRERSYFFMDGALHWLSFDLVDRSSVGIGSFNLSDETFQFVQLPPEIFPVLNVDALEVGVLEGCIAVVNFAFHENVEIWLIKDYKAKESWTKQYMLSLPEVVKSIRLLCILRNGEILLLYNDINLVCFNPTSGGMSGHRLPGVSEISEIFVHVGTLISPIRRNRG